MDTSDLRLMTGQNSSSAAAGDRLNVIFAHDWLTGMRGGERVLETLCRNFSAAPIFTLINNSTATSEIIRQHPITSSWLQQVPGITRSYRYFLPFFPAAMEHLQPPNADVLISISHCIAKGLKPQPGTRHLCYCLTPMRYAWLFYEEYFGTNPVKKAMLKPILARLREWDRQTSKRVDRFVTLSRHVQKRIRMYYNRDADVVYPPVNTTFWTPDPDQTTEVRVGAELGAYDLIVSALVPYKRIDLAVKAYTKSGAPLVIVGTGPEFQRLRAIAGTNVRLMGKLTDKRIRNLYRGCRMLIFPGEEDFGIVPVEAQACGRPVAAYGQGGALETVTENITGVFFREQTEEALLDAVTRCSRQGWNPSTIRSHAEQFSEDRFISGLKKSLEKCLASAAPVSRCSG